MTKKNVGCIKNKAPLSRLTAKYRIPYIAIALIHHFGASKYGYYSWYNDPANCNSTVSDNLNAIFRHMVAHRIGKIIVIDRIMMVTLYLSLVIMVSLLQNVIVMFSNR